MTARLKHHGGWRRTRERGQAYLEFVLVLPGVLLLLLLAWELAYFWWGRMIVSSGTFEATRAVASGQPASTGYQIYDQILGTGLGQMSAVRLTSHWRCSPRSAPCGPGRMCLGYGRPGWAVCWAAA